MTKISSTIVSAFAAILLTSATHAAAPLVVHEWGTFTSRQAPSGDTLYGRFIDNEPVPDFVHSIVPKNGFAGNPTISMRLETPVLYFYPPKSQPLPMQVDVHVGMKGGWLTEFYPDAEAKGIEQIRPRLTKDTFGTLSWKNLKVGGSGQGPVTTAPVWTAPRKVASAMIDAPSGESEKYLFYRGVANLEAPITVSRKDGKVVVQASKDFSSSGAYGEIGKLWHVDIKGGKVAFREVSGLTPGSDGAMRSEDSGRFADADYSKENLELLKTKMHAALVEDGLFADEATAMLNTWQHSYFQTEGRRMFFVVPRKWTDHYLPLQISVPAEIDRVMIGRIEMTPGEVQSQ